MLREARVCVVFSRLGGSDDERTESGVRIITEKRGFGGAYTIPTKMYILTISSASIPPRGAPVVSLYLIQLYPSSWNGRSFAFSPPGSALVHTSSIRNVSLTSSSGRISVPSSRISVLLVMILSDSAVISSSDRSPCPTTSSARATSPGKTAHRR